MDVSDQPASESVMIALLPIETDWCKIELPHLTLVYAGLKEDLKPSAFNELAKDAAMLAMLSHSVYLKVMSKEVFGEASDTDVFRLEPSTQLWAMRRAVESWNASKFSFSPHVTIGPAGSYVESVPRYIGFDRIMVGWGDDQLVFWMKR